MATFSQLPRELQQNILDHLVVDKKSLTRHDCQNLLAPMRVNSCWFNHTADILWNKVSNLETTFSNMGFEQDRRQFYVSKIRTLNLHTARIYFDLIEGLNFESLTHLMLRGDHMGILPFLQPNLKTIIFRASFALTKNELHQMAILCPNLHELKIIPANVDNHRALTPKPNPDPIDPCTFGSFFQHCRHLRSLDIGSKLPSPLVSAALLGLRPLAAAQLEELILTSIEPAALPDDIHEILEVCTSLRKFEIRSNYYTGDPFYMTLLLRGLATIPGLEHLRLDHGVVEDDVEEFTKRHNAPFGNLQSLALKGDMASISSFLSLSMQSLTRLQLVVDDHAHHICPTIGRLQNLTYLNLVIGINHRNSYWEGVRYHPQAHDWQATLDDMQALSTLSRLRSVNIRPININLTAPWLTDDYFFTWTSSFPHLRDLELDIECPVSFTAIVALSKTHALLRKCKLLWIQEIDNWDDLPAPEFLNLQQLTLNFVANIPQDELRSHIYRRFFKSPRPSGSISMTPMQLSLGSEHPYRRPGQDSDEPRVVTLGVKTVDSY
ncbi:unnamed protein product [Aureobasidium uvarum]|uniref:F-box domain-containing protein n=1 Tax=Aureobasidium uvarum TaxID=2773716 RepID=A0A9N8KSU6_9PEZI|nr:unnamed protein product [Aureobasidium uvarum]